MIPFSGGFLIAQISVLFHFGKIQIVFSACMIPKIEETFNLFFLFHQATNTGSPGDLTGGQSLLHSQETKIVGTNARTKLRNEKAFHGLQMPVLSSLCSQKTLKYLG